MDIGDKVSEEGEGNGERPDDEPLISPVVQVHHLVKWRYKVLPMSQHLFKQPLKSRGILDGWRRSRRKEGGEGEGADDEDGGEGGQQLQARFQPVVLEDVLVDKAQPDGEDGAARGDDPIDDAHPLLEVVAKDGEGGGVDQASSGPKHDAIGEVQNLHLVRIGLNFASSSQDTCL